MNTIVRYSACRFTLRYTRNPTMRVSIVNFSDTLPTERAASKQDRYRHKSAATRQASKLLHPTRTMHTMHALHTSRTYAGPERTQSRSELVHVLHARSGAVVAAQFQYQLPTQVRAIVLYKYYYIL